MGLREQIRAHGWEHQVSTLVADVRYAARVLRRRPGFAAIATLTLALGIGASTAIFSAVWPILFAPLPYARADRVVMLTDFGENNQPVDVTFGTFHELVERSRSFRALAVTDRWQPALMGITEPERLTGALVSSQYFRAMGVVPAVGRDFTDSDDRPGAPRVVILSEALARRRFGGAPAAIGRAVQLDGDAFTVIGVMPPRFEDVLTPSADIWSPRRYRTDAGFMSAEWGHHLRMLGRLVPGLSLEQARREVASIGRSPRDAFPRPPWATMENGLQIRALQSAVTHDVQPALLAILAAVALLLVIAAVNVTNLLLARSAQRRAEIALRATLGADRRRLVRQLLTESLLLALPGGALGVLVAAACLQVLKGLAPPDLPRSRDIRIDAAVLVFATVVTLVVGVTVGIVPALRSTNRNLHEDVRIGARTTSGVHHRLRRGLVVTEVALSLIVLVGAGLMVRSLARLFATSPGFAPSNIVTIQVDLAGHRYDSDTARYQYFRAALDAVRAVPGVRAAAFTSQLPLSGDMDGYGVAFESVVQRDPGGIENALRYAVTPGWFRAMGIPLRRGRLLDDRDRPGATEAVVISESLARRVFGDRDPIGERLRAGPDVSDSTRPWGIVVGEVGDVKQASLALGAEDAFYVAMGQWTWVDRVQSLVVRSSIDPVALVPAIERAIRRVDPGPPISRVVTMDQLIETSEAQRRFVLTVFAAFGLAALALAAIGIFGLVSGGVTERMGELGVRAALGASRPGLMLLILREGVGLAIAGSALGLAGAGLTGGLLRSLLYGISPGDPASYVGAGVAVLLVALVASLAPAWRAVRVDPAAALRT